MVNEQVNAHMDLTGTGAVSMTSVTPGPDRPEGVCTKYTPGQVRDTLPVVAVKVTVGDGRDRAVVGYLPTEGWWCDTHGKRACAHLPAALTWLAREHEVRA